MVLTQKWKANKPSKGHWATVQIRTNIPFKKNKVVTHTTVAHKVNNHVVTQSMNVIVPMPPSTPSDPPDPLPSVDDTPPKPAKPTCKGPSCSVLVWSHPLFTKHTNSHTFRLTLNSMFNSMINFPMSLWNMKYCTWELLRGGSVVGLGSVEQEGPAGGRCPRVYDQLLDR